MGQLPYFPHHAFHLPVSHLPAAANPFLSADRFISGSFISASFTSGSFILHGFLQSKLCSRRIMPVLHPRRFRPYIFLHGAQYGRVNGHLPQHFPEHFHGDSPRAQDRRHRGGHVHNGRLHTDSHRPSVNDHVNASIHVLPHMVCRGRAWTARGIGAGRCHRNPGQGYQASSHRVVGHADSHCVKPSRGAVGHPAALWEYHGQRAGPEGFHQFPAGHGYLLYQGRQICGA